MSGLRWFSQSWGLAGCRLTMALPWMLAVLVVVDLAIAHAP